VPILDRSGNVVSWRERAQSEIRLLVSHDKARLDSLLERTKRATMAELDQLVVEARSTIAGLAKPRTETVEAATVEPSLDDERARVLGEHAAAEAHRLAQDVQLRDRRLAVLRKMRRAAGGNRTEGGPDR
jgi:hypothetical protein